MRRSGSIHRLVPMLAIAALAVGLLGAPAAAASTVVVDDDGKATPTDCTGTSPAATSIQAAVDAAAPGTTILVCPGSYKELVTVGAGKNRLELRSTTPFGAKLRVPANVDVDGLVTIDGADAVTVRGFALLSGDGKSCGSARAGIVVRDAQDAVIRGNRIAPTATETLGPCGFAWGIAVGIGPVVPKADIIPPASALIAWNLVRDPRFGGIRVAGPETSATVTRNSIRYWHEGVTPTRIGRRALKPAAGNGAAGIAVLEGADALIERNAVTSGELADPNADGLQPAGGSTPILPIGIAVGVAGTVRVADNLVRRVMFGMSVADNASLRVVENEIGVVRTGIFADDEGARFLRNSIRDPRFGIIARGAGQTFRDNHIADASDISCLDETTGGGTLGTANTWVDNAGTVSYPIGICGSGTPTIHVTFVVRLPATAGTLRNVPASVAGTWTTTPYVPVVPLTSDGIDAWTATVDLPLGGSYSYHYVNEFGTAENACNPSQHRSLDVVNEGGLTMQVEDVFDTSLGLSLAIC